MALENVELGDDIKLAVEKVNQSITVANSNADDIADIFDGDKPVGVAKTVPVYNIDNTTESRPIIIAASGVATGPIYVDKSPIYVDADDLNYIPSSGTLKAPKFKEGSQLLEDKYVTKTDFDAAIAGAGKVDDVYVNGSTVVDPEDKIARIEIKQTIADFPDAGNYILSSLIGQNGGIAELDENGLVPASRLPSYVDDVLEYSSRSNFPIKGETGKIYVDLYTNITYRWGGSEYVEISASLALGTTDSTAYRGDWGAENRTDINTIKANYVSTSGTLTNNTIILGNGSKTVKGSGVTVSDTVSPNDTTIPTGQAVLNYVSTQSPKLLRVTFSTDSNDGEYFIKTFSQTVPNPNNVYYYVPNIVMNSDGAQLLVAWEQDGRGQWVLYSHIELSDCIAFFTLIPNFENVTD